MRAALGVDMQLDAKGAKSGDLGSVRRLQVRSLTDSDIGKVATFLRIGRDRLQCEWQVVFGGELDVLMLGGDDPDTVVGAMDGPLATLRVVDGGAGGCAAVGVLTRPLQYDAFVDALSALELGVVSDPHAETRPVAPTVATAVPPGAKFRLRRWPPTAVLQGHRYHVRLASCMSARPVGIDELVRLSNVGRPACEEFLATLIEQNMLDLRSANEAPPPMAAAAAPRTAAPAAPAEAWSLPDTGLLAKIRRGLGLALLR
jgi:hypothetical protein